MGANMSLFPRFAAASLAIHVWIGTVVVCPHVLSQDKPQPAAGIDVKAPGVRKFEAAQSQIGYSSTKVFYTVAARKLVVLIHLDNEKKGFPITGSVYKFADNETAESLDKWLNNQYSDALFVDAAKPVATYKLAAEACQTIESKRVGREEAGLGVYDKYAVQFSVKASKVADGLQLLEFKDATSVYAPVKK